jgi:glutamate formiminotransferase / formiminotetrahydrofolate cyclodeaminase
MAQLVECVPNFSEGRDRSVIDAIASAISGVTGVKLLDVDPGADTNRTVYTFVGTPDAVAEAAFQAARQAGQLIDMRVHKGAHPRMGAMDVCPFVPVAGITMAECADLARRLGHRIGDELGVPVFFYEHAASRPERRSLANIRAGEYEGLAGKLEDPAWIPDAGPARFDARFGGTVVGAREFLLAYNVNLNTLDRKLANEIALNIREGGRAKRDALGNIMRDASGASIKVPGRLEAVRAIGWYIEQYRQAQVSINLLDYHTTPLHTVFETVRDEAEKLGLIVTGSELVGLTPLEPVLEAGRHFLRKQGKSAGVPERELVEIAIRSLGLDSVAPFDADKKIIEYHVKAAAPLMSMTATRFVDEVSTEAPAPGGGSVAALMGSLAAALATMVANLTIGKKGYEDAWAAMGTLAERGQVLKDRLALAVDLDTEAFNRVMDAMRLPKGTPDEAAARDHALEVSNRYAAEVPLDTVRMCLDTIRLAADAARQGNRNSSSDAGVAALAARAGAEGAALNVLTNLASVSDEAFKQACVLETGTAIGEIRQICDEVQAHIKAGFCVKAGF